MEDLYIDRREVLAIHRREEGGPVWTIPAPPSLCTQEGGNYPILPPSLSIHIYTEGRHMYLLPLYNICEALKEIQ